MHKINNHNPKQCSFPTATIIFVCCSMIGVFQRKKHNQLLHKKNKKQQSQINQEGSNKHQYFQKLRRDHGKGRKQMSYLRRSNINKNMKMLGEPDVKLPNPQCIGCSEFYEDYLIPQTEQTLNILAFDSPTFKTDLTKLICVTLNMGGGYLLINGRPERYIRGIYPSSSFNQISIEKVLQKCGQKIMPFLKMTASVRYLNLIKNPFLTFQPEEQRFVILIELRHCAGPSNKQIKYPYGFGQRLIFFVHNSVKGFSETNHIYISQESENGRVLPKDMSNIILQVNKGEKNIQHKLCSNEQGKRCIGELLGRKRLLNSFQIYVEQEIDEPEFPYKSSALLILGSDHKDWLIGQLSAVFDAAKLKYRVTKPYKKYRNASGRSIWVLSYNSKFSAIKEKIDEIPNEKISVIDILLSLSLPGYFQSKVEYFEKIFKIKFPNCAYSRLQSEGEEKLENLDGPGLGYIQKNGKVQGNIKSIGHKNSRNNQIEDSIQAPMPSMKINSKGIQEGDQFSTSPQVLAISQPKAQVQTNFELKLQFKDMNAVVFAFLFLDNIGARARFVKPTQFCKE